MTVSREKTGDRLRRGHRENRDRIGCDLPAPSVDDMKAAKLRRRLTGPRGIAESAGTLDSPASLTGATMPAVLAPPATIVTPDDPSWHDARQEPTLASVWQAVAGTTIGDELLEWPPDLFALTEVILQRSEAYRFALSPPAGSNWPPAGVPDWPDAVTEAARRWSAWAEDRNGAIPRLLAQEWGDPPRAG